MFLLGSKSRILYLTHNKIFFCKDSKTTPLAFDWNGKNLKEVFSAIKKQTKSSFFRVIVGNDLSYIFTLTLPSASKIEDIIQKTSEVIPEEIDKNNIAYRVSGQNNIEVFALSETVLAKISQGASENGVTIEYYCPVQGILATVANKSEKAILVLFSGIEQLAVIAYKGMVLASENITEKPDKDIETLKEFVRDKFNLETEEVYSNFEGEKNSFIANKTAKKIIIDLLNLISTQKASGEDKSDSFLTIKPPIKKESKETAKGTTSGQQTSFTDKENDQSGEKNVAEGEEEKKSSPLVAIILIVIIVLALGYLGYRVFHDLF